MTARPFAALLLAFSLMQPVSAAFAETQPQVQKAGFSLFGKKKAKQAVHSDEAARYQVKEMVAYATANKPKGRIWCVPFARAVTGIEIKGNAKTWWSQA